ncbi:MAG: alpha/beta fold hydrolase [Myxococcota bacterium]
MSGSMSGLLERLWPARGNLRSASDSVVIELGVPYAGQRSQPKQHLDLFVPPCPTDAPMVLFVHGGAWKTQDRRYLQPWLGLYGNVGRALARRGLVVAVASYRQPDADESLHDLHHALATLRQQGEQRGAATQVVLVGHSAGAHLAAWLAHAVTPRVAGVVGMGGYYDPDAFARAMGRGSQRLRAIFGDGARWSVPAQLGPDSPPIFAVVAQRDPEPIRQAHAELREAARRAGSRCESWVAPGIGHMGLVLSMGRSIDRVSDRIARFAHGCMGSRSS